LGKTRRRVSGRSVKGGEGPGGGEGGGGQKLKKKGRKCLEVTKESNSSIGREKFRPIDIKSVSGVVEEPGRG